MIVENSTVPPSDQPALRVTAMPADTNPYRDLQAQLARPDRRDIAAGAGTEHDEVVRFSHLRYPLKR